jgi:pimeloyl-ACP methyl ester carboxylesterase
MSVCLRVPRLARFIVRVGLRVSAERASTITDPVVDTYTRPLLRPGTIRCLWRFVLDNRHASTLDLATVLTPTLVVSAGRDRIVAAPETARLALGIPGARHVTVPGASHLLAVERPQELAGIVEAFLDE